MNNDLISREALKQALHNEIGEHVLSVAVDKVIDNAPTVSFKGDLISREYLRDAFDNLCCHNCKTCRNFRSEDSFYKCNLIERAPIVELATNLQPTCNTLQQGEWIEGENGNIKCSQCGCEIRYWRLYGNDPDYPKFCCDCGSTMKGGAE